MGPDMLTRGVTVLYENARLHMTSDGRWWIISNTDRTFHSETSVLRLKKVTSMASGQRTHGHGGTVVRSAAQGVQSEELLADVSMGMPASTPMVTVFNII
jgi:hypothetical protein